MIANNGTVAFAGAGAIELIASATGGAATGYAGSNVGGAATGGTALVQTQGTSGTIVSNTTSAATSSAGAIFDVSAQGGGVTQSGGGGGAATGGTATIAVTGAGQSISLTGIPTMSVLALAQGGSAYGGGGGQATGGTVNVNVTGGSLTTSALAQFDAAATGGGDMSGNGGTASGGNVLVNLATGGSLKIDLGTVFTVSASGGSSIGFAGGNALGGNVLVNVFGGSSISLADTSGGIGVDTSSTGGTGYTTGTIASAGGGRFNTDGPLVLDAPVTLTGNTSLVLEAAGSIGITAPIIGTGNGAYLQLHADTGGTGTGTVTLGSGVIDLSGTGAAVDIDYNPTALGTPTNFAPGVTAGLLTAYQLVDNVTQLQQVGSFLSQNFALSKNIDATASQGMNAGAGFVPIGSAATLFTGNLRRYWATPSPGSISTPRRWTMSACSGWSIRPPAMSSSATSA